MIRKIGDTSVSYKYTSRYVLKAGQTVTVSEFSHQVPSLSYLTKYFRKIFGLKRSILEMGIKTSLTLLGNQTLLKILKVLCF